MKTQKDIEDKAKEAYDTYFKDHEEKTDDAFRGHDVVLDTEKLEHDVEEKKREEEKKHESLEVMKEEIIERAEDSLKKIFGHE